MSYHSKNGKFTTKAAAHTVSKGGERFKVVRQYRRIKGGGEQVATHQRKTQSHEKVVEAIELAKAKAAHVRGLLGRSHVSISEMVEAVDTVMLLKDAVGRMIGVYDMDHQDLLAKELKRYEMHTGKRAGVSVMKGASARRITQQAQGLKKMNRDTMSEAYAPGDRVLTVYYKGGPRMEKKIRGFLKKKGIKVIGHETRKEQLKGIDDPFYKRRAKSYFDLHVGTWDEADKVMAEMEAEGLDVYYDR